MAKRWPNSPEVSELAFERDGESQRVLIAGEDVTEAIRSAEVTEGVSTVADQPPLREELGRRQSALGEARPTVAEGRDMGSVVFPSARWKFFLEASPPARARRRMDQLSESGAEIDEAELIASITERDRRDRERPVGALIVAPDAIVIDTTDMTEERVVSLLEILVREDLKATP